MKQSSHILNPIVPRMRLRFLPKYLGGDPSYRGRGWKPSKKRALRHFGRRSMGNGSIPSPGEFEHQVHHIWPAEHRGPNIIENFLVVDPRTHANLDIIRRKGVRA